MKPTDAIITAHFVTFIIFICVRSYVGYGQSFSMCRANRVLHLHNRRGGILQIVRLQRDTLTYNFLLWFVWYLSLFIKNVRLSDGYRRQLRGISGLYLLYNLFTTVKRR